MMSPRIRKLNLTAHVVSSVGWFGTVVGFLGLAIVGLTSRDPEMVRAAYLAAQVTAWFAIVPLALASLLTGIVQAIGTPWGLFRHAWVIAKLALTAIGTIVLLLKLPVIGLVAHAAAATTLSAADLVHPRLELLVHSGGGLVLLLAATILAIYKPQGRSREFL